MKRLKALFLLIFLLVGAPALAQEVARGYFSVNDCATIFGPSAYRVVCLQLENAGNRTYGNEYQWTGTTPRPGDPANAWIQYNGTGGGGGGTGTITGVTAGGGLTGGGTSGTVTLSLAPFTIYSILLGSGSNIPQQGSPGTAGQCFMSNGPSAYPSMQTCPSTTANPASNYAWTGTNSWLSNNWSLLDSGDNTKILKWNISGFTTATTRTMTLPNFSTRLIGDSDFPGSAFMVRTGSGTYTARSFGSVANEIVITNPDGLAGPPTFGLGTLAVKTNQSNTFTTGDQDCTLCSSFKVPTATGLAPTVSGRIAYNTTTNRWAAGVNGATQTLAYLAEVQGLNANLTALSGLTGANNGVPIFTGVGTMTSSVLPPCADTGGNHLNYDNTAHTWSCGQSSTGGLIGLTTGTIPVATTGSSIGNSIITQTTGPPVATVAGSVVVGGAGPYGIFDTSAVATSDKTWTFQNATGLIPPATTGGGAITDGHVVKFAVAAGVTTLVDGGLAGSGTWTDSSTNTGTFKTIQDVLAGGTGNHLWTPVRASWDAGSLTADGTFCLDPVKTTIGTGPTQYVITCADNSSSTFDGQLTLPITMAANLATVKFILTVNDVDSLSQVFAGTFKAMCRGNNTAVNGTWGTTVAVSSPAMAVAGNNYSVTSAAVTPNGTCSAGSVLFWRFTVDSTPNTDNGNARVISVGMEQQS